MSDTTARTALALSVVSIVPAIYGAVLPAMSEARAQADDRGHLAAGERYAALTAGAVVLGVAAVTRSPEAALIGTIAVLAFAVAYHSAVAATP